MRGPSLCRTCLLANGGSRLAPRQVVSKHAARLYTSTPVLLARTKPSYLRRTTQTSDGYSGMQPDDFDVGKPVPQLEEFEGYQDYKEALESGADILPADMTGRRRYGEADEHGNIRTTEDELDDLDQEPYSFDLEEPELGFTGYGLLKSKGEGEEVKERNAYPAVLRVNDEFEHMTEEEKEAELMRRRAVRDAEFKRRRKGDFLDFVRIKVRGGRGGTGAAAFTATRSGDLGAPAGGNGGPGGDVYVRATTNLTSLHMIPRRYLGEQGNNGAGDLRHGAAGPDTIIEVPVGTVLREVSREGDEERHWYQEEADGVELEDRKWLRWERWFHVNSIKPFEERYFKAAERLLRREKKWATRTPTFEEVPPVVYDLTEPSDAKLVARGGQGGLGNPFFAGVLGYRQPRLSSRGIMPYTSVFEVELKILADVGLVGFPNAGKSTILRALTGRRAEVAGYQFTTLNPQVGVVRVWDDGTWGSGGVSLAGESGVVEDTWRERARDKQGRETGEYNPLPRSERVREARDFDAQVGSSERVESYRFTISDNPGLLPQASDNVGLGHSFLRSIERSKALAYILDISRPNPEQDLIGLRNELEAYKPGLPASGAVVVLNKGDTTNEEEGREKVAKVKEAIKGLDEEMSLVVLSGKFGLGLDKLVKKLGERVQAVRHAEEEQKAREAGL